ncbi:Cupin domain protein [compost metagenome]
MISGVCKVDVLDQLQSKKFRQESSNTLKKGDFILIDANVPHRLIVEKENPCRMLNIEFRFCAKSSQDRFPSIRQCLEDCGEGIAEIMSAPFTF